MARLVTPLASRLREEFPEKGWQRFFGPKLRERMQYKVNLVHRAAERLDELTHERHRLNAELANARLAAVAEERRADRALLLADAEEDRANRYAVVVADLLAEPPSDELTQKIARAAQEITTDILADALDQGRDMMSNHHTDGLAADVKAPTPWAGNFC